MSKRKTCKSKLAKPDVKIKYAITSTSQKLWEPTNCTTLRGAKCKATQEFGAGDNMDILMVAEYHGDRRQFTDRYVVVASKPNCPGGQWDK
jgi:hypothetical protein